jgi:hypothetical protein
LRWTECITMDAKSIEVNIVNGDEEAHKEENLDIE